MCKNLEYREKACWSMLVPVCSFCDRMGLLLVYSISTTHFSRIHIYTRGVTELLQAKYYFACLSFGDRMQWKISHCSFRLCVETRFYSLRASEAWGGSTLNHRHATASVLTENIKTSARERAREQQGGALILKFPKNHQTCKNKAVNMPKMWFILTTWRLLPSGETHFKLWLPAFITAVRGFVWIPNASIWCLKW